MEREQALHTPYLQGFEKDLAHMKSEAYKDKVQAMLKRPFQPELSNGVVVYPRLALSSKEKVRELAIAQKAKQKGSIGQSNLVKHDMAVSSEDRPDLAMAQSLLLPLSERLDLGLCTQIRQQNNWANAYVQPSFTYRADHGLVCQASLLAGDHSRVQLLLQKAMGRGVLLGFGYQTGLRRTCPAQECFQLLLQRENLSAHLSIGDQGCLALSYQRPLGPFSCKASSALLPSRSHQSRAQLSLPLPGDKKLTLTLTRSSFLSRLRLSLQRRLTHALKIFFSLDTYDSHNLVLFFGLKYKQNLFALPIFSSQSGSLLSLGNIKPLFLAGALLCIAERTVLKDKYFSVAGGEQTEEQEQPGVGREEQMKLIEERARENHQREKACNGLVIVEAYYGESGLIRELQAQQNKAAWLFRQKVPSHLLLDVTMALRFQVQNSSLYLRREEKSYLVGVGRLSTSENLLYIQYLKGGQPRSVLLLSREGLQL